MSEQMLAKAGAAGTLEDICHDYQSSLEDLTFNSKPHINMLTIVAEENLPFAKEIVSQASRSDIFIALQGPQYDIHPSQRLES
uniref:Uncharacterized protein n=1 Tax=Peromyscus maniculatus bairdii TaxID=230844 RepID=A0A8C8UG73_PERMB